MVGLLQCMDLKNNDPLYKFVPDRYREQVMYKYGLCILFALI